MTHRARQRRKANAARRESRKRGTLLDMARDIAVDERTAEVLAGIVAEAVATRGDPA